MKKKAKKEKEAEKKAERKTRSIGDTVTSYCGKCKLDRPHTVTAMDEDVTTEVRCSVCSGSHKPRSAPETGKSRKPETKGGPASAAKIQAIWEARMAEASGKELPYSMAAKYRVGDIVDHFMFGKGVVLRLYPKRCDMLFRDKSRLMVSANQ